MRIIVSFEKQEPVRFISHLDVQRAFHRAIKRAAIPIAFSQGFNPHPQTSFASALSVGHTGGCEWMDIRLAEAMEPAAMAAALNSALPNGLRAITATEAPEGYPSLTSAMHSADYSAAPEHGPTREALAACVEEMLGGPIIISKRKKSGRHFVDTETDVRPMIRGMSVEADGRVLITGRLDASGGLNVESLLRYTDAKLGMECGWRVHRERININGVTAN